METLLAECDLGVNAIRQINDKKGMASYSLGRIADYLGCSVDYLLGRTETPEVSNGPEQKTRRKHDQAGEYGFNVDPELLAHDLALLKMWKQVDMQDLPEDQLYETYTKLLDDMETAVDARIRYDCPPSPPWFDPSSPPDSPDQSEDFPSK